MQEGDVEGLKRALSAERFAAYRGRGSDTDAVVHFLWNTELCEALYPVLHALELALRNTLFHAVAEAYPQAVGVDVPCWMDADPPVLRPDERARVREAKRRLVQAGRPLEPGRVVAELSFGFWTALFDVRYEHGNVLWPRLFRLPPFAGVPRRMRTRKTLSALFNRVRLLRNRAAHHEPLWHWRDLGEQHAAALDLLLWLSPPLHEKVLLVDRFGEVHALGRQQVRFRLGRIAVPFRAVRDARPAESVLVPVSRMDGESRSPGSTPAPSV